MAITADFLTVVKRWQQVIENQYETFLADVRGRHSGLELTKPQEGAIKRGERNAQPLLKQIKNVAIILFWDSTSLKLETQPGPDLDNWVMGISIAVRDDNDKATLAFDEMMGYAIAMRELIRDNIAKMSQGIQVEGFFTPEDYQTIKSITFTTAAQLEELEVGKEVFKQATLLVTHQIATKF
jgi:hypothetical protein